MCCHQVFSLDALTQFHLEPGRLLQVDVEGLHDGRVQVVGVIRQQVRVGIVADVPVVQTLDCFSDLSNKSVFSKISVVALTGSKLGFKES